MRIAKLSLVLADGYAAIALFESGRVTKHDATPSTGNVAHDVKIIFSKNEKELRELGKRLVSVTIVSNVTRTAIRTGSDLSKVGLIRMSAPEGRDSPPLLSKNVANKVLGGFGVVKGGHGFDGRLIGAPDATEIRSCVDEVKRDVDAFVVSSPYSILYPDHEQYAVDTLMKMGIQNVWASTQVSSGNCMLDRETTAILTAATSTALEKVEEEVLLGLGKIGCKPAVYFGRNDGTVFGSALAKSFPLDTAWSVEGHSAAGATKLEKASQCLVVGMSDKESWIAGASNGRPMMRKVSYLSDMLVHVQSPIMATFSSSTPTETKNLRHRLISQFSGAKRTFPADLTNTYDSPFTISKRIHSADYAATNAGTANMEWAWTSHIPRGADPKAAGHELKKRVQAHMKLGAARSCKFGKVTSRPGINLPDGATTLTIQARARTI